MTCNDPITREAYLAAFATWFRVLRDDSSLIHKWSGMYEPQWNEAVASVVLPDQGAPADFCDILAPHPLVRPMMFAIGKSSLLARLIYSRERLRTRRCPAHHGVWSGIDAGPNVDGLPHCVHGCGMVGWLPEPEEAP